MTLTQLIEALERATGLSRELDAHVYATIHGGYIENSGAPEHRNCIWWKDRGIEPALITGFPNMTRKLLCYAEQSPPYSSSLDAALTLVPEGWEWELTWHTDIATAKLGDPLLYLEGESRSPALSIVIASLKARRHTEQEL